MKRILFLTAATSILFASAAESLTVSMETANEIAQKIWKNECACSVEGLTCWNKGENFGSFGIGHFIWYPEGKREGFQESFPELLAFLEKRGALIPAWLKACRGCPWRNREEFYHEIECQKMQQLRALLFETKDLQAIFIAQRLDNLLPFLIKELPPKKQKAISDNFHKLEDDPRGLYALIDYLNFKGAGTSQNETYNHRGWGLLQVLDGMPNGTMHPVEDFVASAKKVLTERVENSPKERNEQRWLLGWHNRVNTYLQ